MKKALRFLFLLAIFFISSCERNEVKKIFLVWMFDPEKFWEADWCRELLASDQYEIEEVTALDEKIYLDRAIYVTQLPREKKELDRFFKTLHKKGARFGIIHISDEEYSHSTKSYSYAKFVLRNYWKKKFDGNPKILQIPLGYKTKFWADSPSKKSKKSSERQYFASFAGQLSKSGRKEMAEHMRKLGHFFVHETSFFGSADALPVDQYRDLLMDSVFAPCPKGFVNVDTFRLYEALEAGAIPIVEKGPSDYYEHLFQGKYPFFAIDQWDEVGTLLNEGFLSDPERIEQKRQECIDWWKKSKEELRKKIQRQIIRSFFFLP